MTILQAKCGCQAQSEPTMEWRFCPLHAAAPRLMDVAGEADTFTQNLLELLREYGEEGDRYAVDLSIQAEALGANARAILQRANR